MIGWLGVDITNFSVVLTYLPYHAMITRPIVLAILYKVIV